MSSADSPAASYAATEVALMSVPRMVSSFMASPVLSSQNGPFLDAPTSIAMASSPEKPSIMISSEYSSTASMKSPRIAEGTFCMLATMRSKALAPSVAMPRCTMDPAAATASVTSVSNAVAKSSALAVRAVSSASVVAHESMGANVEPTASSASFTWPRLSP